MKKIIAALLSAFLLMVSANCYGGFVATRKIYHWNGGLGNKWINTIVMWALIIIPVYELAGLVDFVILNVLEFWTGSNPLAMKEGEKETQIVKRSGKEFEITATKNQFEISEVVNGVKTNPTQLVYLPSESAWFVNANGKLTKISEISPLDEEKARLFHPDGSFVEVKL